MRLASGALVVAGVALAALAVGMPACGSTDEVVARIRCRTTKDCGPGSFCSKATCDAPTGTCELSCSTSGFSPVCGCFGLTYWNDCVRQQHGESATTTGSMDGGTCAGLSSVCSSSTECLSGAFCAKFVCPRQPADPADPVSKAPTGFCFVLPDECPTTSITLPNGLTTKLSGLTCESPPSCTDYCSAVRAGTPVILAPAKSTPDGGGCP